MADHIWKEKGNHLHLWDEVKIIDREEHEYNMGTNNQKGLVKKIVIWTQVKN